MDKMREPPFRASTQIEIKRKKRSKRIIRKKHSMQDIAVEEKMVGLTVHFLWLV